MTFCAKPPKMNKTQKNVQKMSTTLLPNNYILCVTEILDGAFFTSVAFLMNFIFFQNTFFS